jgi:hypothetical protein
MKIKLLVEVETGIYHGVNCANEKVLTKTTTSQVEVDVPEDAIKVFRALWDKNLLCVTITGCKQFIDGVEIT